MSLDKVECGVCGYRLSHINQPCPNCLPGLYRDQFTARMDPRLTRERRALDMARLTLRQIAGQNVDKELFRGLAVVTLVRITEVLGEDA